LQTFAHRLAHSRRSLDSPTQSIACDKVLVALQQLSCAQTALLCPQPHSLARTKRVRLDTTQRAEWLYKHARAVLSACSDPMASEWHKSEPHIRLVLMGLGSVVGSRLVTHRTVQEWHAAQGTSASDGTLAGPDRRHYSAARFQCAWR